MSRWGGHHGRPEVRTEMKGSWDWVADPGIETGGPKQSHLDRGESDGTFAYRSARSDRPDDLDPDGNAIDRLGEAGIGRGGGFQVDFHAVAVADPGQADADDRRLP